MTTPVVDYIEMFYNPTRKHTNNGMLSPVDYEIKQRKMNEAGVYKSRGTSYSQIAWTITSGGKRCR
ncbi:MAG: hypothetical protein ACI83E_002014 [Sulfitobacter sp.]